MKPENSILERVLSSPEQSLAASPFRAEVVLVEPEIPQNTGNIARTCAALGCPLHLIQPLGFSLENRYLRRAGVDYWHLVEVFQYKDLTSFFASHSDGRYFFFTRKAELGYHQASYSGPCYFIFGKESTGLPDDLIALYQKDCYRIPMRPESRSLNISNAVALILYDAYRSNGFPGLI